MNSKKTLEKLMTVLGLRPEVFYEGRTNQGVTIKMEGEMELGATVYISTEEGLIPAPAGEHILEDGSKIEVDDDAKITKIDMGTIEMEVEVDKKDDETEEKFADVKLKDGEVMRVEGDEPLVGLLTKKVSYDGNLLPFTDGDYETTDGKIISIVGGSIQGIKEAGKDEAFTIAETPEGVKIESPTFDVGEEVYVIDGDEKTPAPDGEHQVVLKDESGNENKIRITTKDGIIVQRENVEDEVMSAEEVAELFSMALKKLETKIDSIIFKQSELETKFSKFSKEPAGERVYNQKTIIDNLNESTNKVEAFKRLREAMNKN